MDNFESRAGNIDILKAICAFLIVCIHVPHSGRAGAYFAALTRVAVPIFGDYGILLFGYYCKA